MVPAGRQQYIVKSRFLGNHLNVGDWLCRDGFETGFWHVEFRKKIDNSAVKGKNKIEGFL